jgi:aspartyl aminopeptidase
MTNRGQDLCDYIQASPSPYHCVDTSTARLRAAGFTELKEADVWQYLEPGAAHYVVRDGTLMAWKMGTEPIPVAGLRLIGAHTDSPNLRLKPNADYVREGYHQWGVEVYGGVLSHTWFDRDLGISGRAVLRGSHGTELRNVRIDRPLARIANLAIHLNRGIRTDGFKPNAQRELPPLLGLFQDDAPDLLPRLICDALDVDPADFLGGDLMLHDIQAPVVGGVHNEFVFAPRLDNQASCFTAIEALVAHDTPVGATVGAVLFDHEEVGSRSSSGAAGQLLVRILNRIIAAARQQAPGGLARASAQSFTISSDMAHGVHPNYADRHDGNHKPMLNGGVVIKSNANQRYSTNAETAARVLLAAEAADVAAQQFINRTDLACGTTIGPLAAAELGIRSVDIGAAMLSMHSIREQTGAADVDAMIRVKRELLRG